jgi:transposase
MAILFVGIDLAKSEFALHGVNEHGKAVLVAPKVPHDKLLSMVAALAPCTIGMEAYSGAHHWARQFAQFGHTVRLMAAQFIAPDRMSGRRGKNDVADAAAICKAVQRPNMRFVPIKSLGQQGRLSVHRTRQAFIEQRTGMIRNSSSWS